jgi:hypothetical protein
MHYYERNITDIKDEYTDFLIHIIAPLIYEGIRSMYQKSLEKENECIEMSKQDPRIKNPGVLKIFQHFLKNIPTLNLNLIEAEMIRIRDSSKHADIFEKLIKAVMKSHIILLTYNSSGKQCKLVNEKIHEKIDCKTFIHKIYVECARQFYNNPELFWHNYQSIDIKKNQKDALDIIEKAIHISIKEMLPMNDIIAEYLRNDYIPEETEKEKIERIKAMLNNRPEDQLNFFDDEEKKVLLSDEENNDDEYINKNINDIENLLHDSVRKIEENEPQNEPNIENLSIKQNGGVDNVNDNAINQNNTSINEEEFKQKLHSFGQQPKNKFNMNKYNKQNKQNNNQMEDIPQNINAENENENENNNENNNENINIIKNNVDDRNYYTSLLMN